MTNKQINKLMNCLLNNKNKKIIKYEPINKYRDRQTNEHMYGYLKCRLKGRQTDGRTDMGTYERFMRQNSGTNVNMYM